MRGHCLLVLVVLAVCVLPAQALAAERTKVDRDVGVRLTLKGRQLEARVVRTPRLVRIPPTEEGLQGKRMRFVCGIRFDRFRDGLQMKRLRWPRGALSASVRFARDISGRAKWCMIESGSSGVGPDLAFVSFLHAEPKHLLAKGRDSPDRWWRLSAWRSERLAPCLQLRFADDASSQCFDDDAQSEAELAVAIDVACPGGTFVYGAVARAAAAVAVTLRDGTEVNATLYPRPRDSRVRAQYFMAVLEGIAPIRMVESRDRTGEPVAREQYDADSFQRPCGVFIPD